MSAEASPWATRDLCLTQSVEDAVVQLEKQSLDATQTLRLLSDDHMMPLGCGSGVVRLTDNSERTSEMLVTIPEFRAGERLGVIVCLHGAGGTGSGMTAYFRGLAEATHSAVLCPTAATPSADSRNFDLAGLLGRKFHHPRWVASSGDFPMQALRWAQLNLSVDPDRCALLGYSMGAVAAWALAMRFPHCFSAAVLINGAASMWEMYGPDRETAEMLDNLISLPLLVIHGTADEQIPVRLTKELVSRLRRKGHKDLEYAEVVGGGHDLTTMQMSQGEDCYDHIERWLREKRRSRFPTLLRHRAREECCGRLHWVELRDIPGGRSAAVIGRILSNDTFGLSVGGARKVRIHLNRELVSAGPVNVVVNGVLNTICFTPSLSSVVRSFKKTLDPGLVAEQIVEFNVPLRGGCEI